LTHEHGDDTPTTSGPSHDLLGDHRLWPGAPSVGASATGNEAVIDNLHKRIAQLEETIGRLLLEKELWDGTDAKGERQRGGNCCVTFASAEPSMAELGAIRGGNNCCVTFRGKEKSSEKTKNERAIIMRLAAAFAVLALVMVWTVLLTFARRSPSCPGSDMGKAVEYGSQ